MNKVVLLLATFGVTWSLIVVALLLTPPNPSVVLSLRDMPGLAIVSVTLALLGTTLALGPAIVFRGRRAACIVGAIVAGALWFGAAFPLLLLNLEWTRSHFGIGVSTVDVLVLGVPGIAFFGAPILLYARKRATSLKKA